MAAGDRRGVRRSQIAREIGERGGRWTLNPELNLFLKKIKNIPSLQSSSGYMRGLETLTAWVHQNITK